MPQLSQVQRERVVGMIQAGESCRRVARHFGFSFKTICQLVSRLNQTGSTSDRPRSGRPRKTTARDDPRIRLIHLRNRFVTAVETTRTLFGRRVPPQTVRNRLRAYQLKARLPYTGLILLRRQRNNRHNLTRVHRRWALRQWNNVLFQMSPGFVCNTVTEGAECGGDEGSVLRTAASQNGTALAAEV